ncbi:SdrD B-like domain-containing protein [Macrococcus epidermidis]|uniref:SdrD B-like domain-containing protein n=1 Tax=Macrococcus epidermidis TaxID=1902580 RepID=UPI0020B7E2C4|nr:SdrD B-like domain-containing protein [Macrococcus epidermidis]UTH16000.1 carboxypeptidase regulatory-like domain-containing protein [Macrococcus epidermidis]
MNKYGIRKFTVGTASVVVGSLLFLGAGQQADAAEATYSLGDRVYSDNNGNYVQDAGDTGLAGLTVTIRDYAGNHVATTTTDANGNYSLSGLKNGTYVVNFEVPAGYANDVANIGSEDVDSDGPIDVLVDINGANITTLDTGFIPLNGQGSAPVQGGETTPAPAPAPTKGNLSIGDHVWWDANRNNLYDQGENPVANLRVTIRDYAGNFVAETYTDAYGNYAFHGLSDGQYIVNFHNPLDWSPVIANIDNDVSEAIDSDGPTDVIVNLKGASNFNVDQGYYGVGTPGLVAGGGDNTTPGGGDNTTPGGGDNTTPGGGDNTTPGGGDNTTPGGGDNTTPGDGDNTTPGDGDNTTPGGGDNTTPAPTETKPAPTATLAPVETVTPSEVGKTVLPDTGEKENTGAIASVLALLGGAALLGSRRK